MKINPIAGWQESRIFLQTSNNFSVSSDGQRGSGYFIGFAGAGSTIGPGVLYTLPSQINWIDLYRQDCTGSGLCSHSAELVKRVNNFHPVNNPTRVTVEDNAGHIQVLLNGNSYLDYTDPNPLPGGSIGLGAIWETKATFANLVVFTGSTVLYQNNFSDPSSLKDFTIKQGGAVIENNLLITQGGGVTPTPEPEEWAMMLMGFGMVGYQVKRIQKKAASAVV